MKETKTKKSALGRAILMTVVFTALIIAAAVFTDGSGGGAVERLFGGGADTSFSYDVTGNAARGGVGDSLAVLSSLELAVYDRDGGVRFSEYCRVSAPVVQTAGKYGAAYDAGGGWLCFFTEKGPILTITDSGRIFSASVNKKGWLAVCSEDEGYLGKVEIYDKDGAAVFRWHAGSGYPLAAAADSGGFTAVTLGEGGSRLVWFTYGSTEEKASYETGSLVLAVFRDGDAAAAVTEDGLLLFDGRGQLRASYDLEGRYLDKFAHGDGYTVLVTGEHRMAEERTIAVVDGAGAVKGSLPDVTDVLAVDAAGSRIAVLFRDRAELFGEDMKSVGEKTGVAGADAIFVTARGRIYTAGLYAARNFSVKSAAGGAQ